MKLLDWSGVAERFLGRTAAISPSTSNAAALRPAPAQNPAEKSLKAILGDRYAQIIEPGGVVTMPEEFQSRTFLGAGFE